MDGHRPDVWCSYCYSAQQAHGAAHQTCLAHLARDVAYAEQAGEDSLPSRLQLWLKRAFALADDISTLAASTIATKRKALAKSLQAIPATSTGCDFARTIQNKFRRARDQLLTFALHPGMVEPTNNACEQSLRPAVIQQKVTNGYRAMWAAKGEADIRTVVDTARLRPGANTFKTILQAVTA
ncbi:transposase IS66 family protein [Rhizobium sp. PP-F2F-G20b]|nr:transposase IS66 family protein [Rhizobium sp. PP-F2F-G20b]